MRHFPGIIPLLIFSGLLSGCAPHGMLAAKDCPNILTIKPPEGKSALVIAHTSNYRAAANFDNYLDGKYIGSNKAHSMFITYVDPGTHYISSKGTLLRGYHTTKSIFITGQTYFYQNEISYNPIQTRPDLEQVNAEHLINDMEDKCRLYEVNTKNPEDDIDEDDYKEITSHQQ